MPRAKARVLKVVLVNTTSTVQKYSGNVLYKRIYHVGMHMSCSETKKGKWKQWYKKEQDKKK